MVPPIHEALEKRLGRSVPASTVYRMLARHGWRKVTPATCYPKRDEQAQQKFKKIPPDTGQNCRTELFEPAGSDLDV